MFDLASFIKAAGYFGVAAIVFTESGLLVGIVLPGDSLLFTAGVLASQGYLGIVPLAIAAFVAAVLGDNVGYWLGKRFGRRVFNRERSWFFRPEYVTEAEHFYRQYGAKTVVLARFIPVIRTIAPLLAGVGSMHRRTFVAYNVLGGLLWAAGVPLAGYWLGNAIPGIDRYLIPIVLGIIVVSVAPGAYHFLKHRENRRALAARFRALFSR